MFAGPLAGFEDRILRKLQRIKYHFTAKALETLTKLRELSKEGGKRGLRTCTWVAMESRCAQIG